jgi:hypothetical protein
MYSVISDLQNNLLISCKYIAIFVYQNRLNNENPVICCYSYVSYETGMSK